MILQIVNISKSTKQRTKEQSIELQGAVNWAPRSSQLSSKEQSIELQGAVNWAPSSSLESIFQYCTCLYKAKETENYKWHLGHFNEIYLTFCLILP